MLIHEQKKEAYNKAAFNRELRDGPLSNRTRGSVEMRMCNISSVIQRSGRQYIPGYKPRPNVGTYVESQLKPLIEKYYPTGSEQGEDLQSLVAGLSVDPPSDDEQTDVEKVFTDRLQSVFRQGSFSSTYKYAVILGLLDLCLERFKQTGEVSPTFTTRQLAEKVLEFYWLHTLPFSEGLPRLLQNSGSQANILTKIAAFREQYASDVTTTLLRVKDEKQEQYSNLVRDIEWTLVKMPLPKLQRIGHEVDEFLYQIDWDDEITRRDFNSSNFNNQINLVGSSGDHLVRLDRWLRPLVQREWANLVVKFNADLVASAELEAYLFGEPQVSFTTDEEIQKSAVVSALDVAEDHYAKSRGQGFSASPKRKRAVELHAMSKAKSYLEMKGYQCQDTSANRPYDIEARKDGQILYVEVKGTTAGGEHVFVTKNEVEHARLNSDNSLLFILHDIEMDDSNPDSPKASGGVEKVVWSWSPEPSHLTCLSYRYEVDVG
jgi:hypothetical protein